MILLFIYWLVPAIFLLACLLWEMIWSKVDSLKIARSQGSS